MRSSSGSEAKSSFNPRLFSTSLKVSLNTPSVRSPSTSILGIPTAEMESISNCVITRKGTFSSFASLRPSFAPFPPIIRWRGTSSVKGSREITTPPACVEACRASPSMVRAVSISLCREGLLSTSSRISASSPRNSESDCMGPIRLQILSTSGIGTRSTRPASRSACLAPIVPKVIICATRSGPYRVTAYSITSSRRAGSKSQSISGSEMRSRFVQRSKGSPKRMGLTSVTPRTYNTSAPGAEPRPGPTRISFLRANSIKSQAMSKKAAKPRLEMIPSSFSSLRFSSGFGFGKR